MQITTKYSVGDTVYAVYVGTDENWVTCPDCLGTKAWKAITPAGEELDIECPVCKHGYATLGKISNWEVTGRVQTLTVGQVRYENDGAVYMCEETGVGSGILWAEEKLFENHIDAFYHVHFAVEATKAERIEEQARRYAKRKGGDIGCMTAYYRKQIRDAKKQIKQAEDGLERIKPAAVNGGRESLNDPLPNTTTAWLLGETGNKSGARLRP